MHIALITDGIWPYVLGGMQKHSFYLAKYFAKNKIHVDLFHCNNSSYDINLLEFFTEEEKMFIHPVVLNFPHSIHFPGHYIYNSYRYSCLVFNSIKNKLHGYDYIYTKGFTGWKLLSERRKRKISCCKIGVNFHGYEMFQLAPNFKTKLEQFLLKPFVIRINKNADTVFSYGGNISGIIKNIGISSNKIIEIPSGIESEYISSSVSSDSKKIKKFIFVGRAERRKGIEELNQVIETLIAENQLFQFDFIGPIPSSMKINHSFIKYHNEIRDFIKIKHLLSENDILVCPSWSEGFPNVILEAMACGLAIIATNVGAINTMVSSKNGWIIEPNNKIELENSIKKAINEPDLILKKQHSLHLMKTQFNWDIISIETINAIIKNK